jgi:phosphohistidine phosphatase
VNLYLIRHGVAEVRRSDEPDASRPLTEEGRVRFIRAVKGMKRLGIRFDQVLYSPLVRAAETATLLEPIIEGESEETALLARAPTKQLLELPRGDHVALVGHEPWLGELLAMLCVKEPVIAAPAMPVPLKKGGVAMLEGECIPGGMILRGLLPPRVLRKV